MPTGVNNILPTPNTPTPIDGIPLSSQIWRSTPADLTDEIVLHLPSVADSMAWVISCSHTSRSWRNKLSKYIFEKILIMVRLPEVEESGADTRTSRLHNSLRDLREFRDYLDNDKDHRFARHVKDLSIIDEGAPNNFYWDTLDDATLGENARLLSGVLRHFPHLQRLELDTLLPLNPFAIPETRRTVDVDVLYMRFWHEDLGHLKHAVPRFIGLLSMFGAVHHLRVYDDMPYSEPFRGGHLPALSTRLQVSRLEFLGACEQPSIIRTLVSPPITSKLEYLDIGGIVEDQLDELRELFLESDLDPEHLVLSISEPPGLESPESIDLSSKSTTRLKEITLKIPILSSSETITEDMQLYIYGTSIKCATNLVASLNKPWKPTTVEKLKVEITGMTHLNEPVQPLRDLTTELDNLLFELHVKVGLRVAIELRDWFSPVHHSEQLLNLFPRSQTIVESFPTEN